MLGPRPEAPRIFPKNVQIPGKLIRRSRQNRPSTLDRPISQPTLLSLFATAHTRLRRLQDAAPAGSLLLSLKGLEKEGLRVDPDGYIAQTTHPVCLGSALTHPYITTDYSEALLELITPPFAALPDTLAFLTDLHAWVSRCLDNESVWATSMPCIIDSEERIPIARYGNSNVGMMKHIYRRGLAYRYGKTMQTIAGIHFNFSFPEIFWELSRDQDGAGKQSLQSYISQRYFGLIRNLQRLAWLFPYLFGASPTVCSSFFQARTHTAETYVPQYATCLRMSDIGYQNSKQADLYVSYNDLDSYVECLTRAIETPVPRYQAIGVKVDGEYRQLSANMLQIENEYYSFVRPKRTIRSGEKPTVALKRRGVEYLELRALDVNVYEPLGVSAPQLRFIEALLVLCAMGDSPLIDPQEQERADHNTLLIARSGRDPALQLHTDQGETSPQRWALALCDILQPICQLLDGGDGHHYRDALSGVRATVEAPDSLPSARILADMERNGESFFEFAMRLSGEHHAYFTDHPLQPEREQQFAGAVRDSLSRQSAMEAADGREFDDYLAKYFAQR